MRILSFVNKASFFINEKVQKSVFKYEEYFTFMNSRHHQPAKENSEFFANSCPVLSYSNFYWIPFCSFFYEINSSGTLCNFLVITAFLDVWVTVSKIRQVSCKIMQYDKKVRIIICTSISDYKYSLVKVASSIHSQHPERIVKISFEGLLFDVSFAKNYEFRLKKYYRVILFITAVLKNRCDSLCENEYCILCLFY